VSLKASLLYKSNEHKQLADMKIRPEDYTDAYSFHRDYTTVSFARKYKGLNTGVNTGDEALRSFRASEVTCAWTNWKMRLARSSPSDYGSQLWVASRKILRVLGQFNLSKVNQCGWGPGATDDLKRSHAFPDSKLVKLPISVTQRAYPHMVRQLQGDLHWSSVVLGVKVEELSGPFSFLPGVFQVTPGNVIDTVPKSALTDRTIAKEPRGNGFLQKGVGRYIRKRLKSVGIDLDDQSRNQIGASRAQADGLATLDLSAASDTVSTELVYELLPIEWALYMDDIRSQNYRVGNTGWRKSEKFSSMGNAFTFELESLIFWALAEGSRDTLEDAEPMVYGDDIIVSKTHAPRLVDLLSFCGFTVNPEKSFMEGRFYESCGKHYFDGYDVTPIYQKEIPYDGSLEIIRLGNRLIRLASSLALRGHPYGWLTSAWRAAWASGGETRGFQIPLGTEGDDGWAVTAENFSLVLGRGKSPQDPNLGLRCRVVRRPLKRYPAHEGALLALALRTFKCTSWGPVVDGEFEPSKGNEYPGEVTREDVYSHEEGYRWVIPTGEFDLT